MPRVQVALLPSAVQGVDLSESVAVVIDVLRATTTIIHALAAGAEAVIPCSEVEEAFAVRDRIGSDQCVLGGERHGLLIPGFQLDNSPFGYTRQSVGGKMVVFTTTNGTRALAAVRPAATILIASFANLGAVIDRLRNDGSPVWIVCAGTDGFVTAEDVLVAGSIVAALEPPVGSPHEGPRVEQIEALHADIPNSADFAARFALAHGQTLDGRVGVMRASRGGRNLIDNGFNRDIARAAEVDIPGLNLTPIFHDNGLITAICADELPATANRASRPSPGR